jgi:hypothetical protein
MFISRNSRRYSQRPVYENLYKSGLLFVFMCERRAALEVVSALDAVPIKPGLRPPSPKKREYFKYPPETFHDLAPAGADLGA